MTVCFPPTLHPNGTKDGHSGTRISAGMIGSSTDPANTFRG
jgi:hypothetical protein